VFRYTEKIFGQDSRPQRQKRSSTLKVFFVPKEANGTSGVWLKPKSGVQAITIEQYVKSLRKSQFKEVQIRPTPKGWLMALTCVALEYVLTERKENAGIMNPFYQSRIINICNETLSTYNSISGDQHSFLRRL
jgi:hypothetical protein